MWTGRAPSRAWVRRVDRAGSTGQPRAGRDRDCRGALRALRALVRDTQQIERYEPRGDEIAWQDLERRWGG
ncbi:hypothetical protein L083_0723 [Actinoplanes sp. N902-109]|nr:hypothetical protein L083_0723 [Actinoplanes sp. N902-109]